jgi:hypothetical protein
MDIAELLKLGEAERRVLLDRNANRLRTKSRRHDAASYVEEMLIDLRRLASEAGLPRIAASLHKTLLEVRALGAASTPEGSGRIQTPSAPPRQPKRR